MKIIHVGCELEYQVYAPTSFVFSVAAATNPHQTIREESLILNPEQPYDWIALGEEGNRSIRFEAPVGNLYLAYNAVVELSPEIQYAPHLEELGHLGLPAEVLTYLSPSRYCESDRLANFAFKEFGHIDSGYTRVQAVCNWVYEHTDYVSGSTDASSSAIDVLVQRAGVCRDFAHFSIALCRALGIPARYVAGYAPELDPPDFHGFFEAFLNGKWYLFDATRMAPVSSFVRIGAGRDAADASFANIAGNVNMTKMVVSAVNTTDSGHTNPDMAVSTA